MLGSDCEARIYLPSCPWSYNLQHQAESLFSFHGLCFPPTTAYSCFFWNTLYKHFKYFLHFLSCDPRISSRLFSVHSLSAGGTPNPSELQHQTPTHFPSPYSPCGKPIPAFQTSAFLPFACRNYTFSFVVIALEKLHSLGTKKSDLGLSLGRPRPGLLEMADSRRGYL